MALSELFVKIGADFKELDKGFAQIDKKMKDFGAKTEKVGEGLSKGLTAPIVGLGVAIFATAAKVGDYADRILDLEAITGMSTDAIQEFQHVAKIAGVETEAVTTASQKLTKQLTTMSDGTGKAAEALGMLGLGLDEINEMTPDERMNAIIKALTEIEDPALRAQYGTDLLGTAWQNIAPIVAMGAEEIDKARQAARDMGTVMGTDALNDANNFRIEMEKLKAQFGAVFNEVGAKLAPVLTDTLLPIIQDKIIPIIVTFAEFIGNLVDKFSNLDDKTQTMILAFIGILAAIGPVLIVVGKLIPILGMIISPVGLVIAAIALLAAGFIYLYNTNEDFKNFVDTAWVAIKDAIITAVNLILDIVKPALDTLKQFWEENGEQIMQGVKNYFELIFNILKGTLDAIITVVEFFMPLIQGIFKVGFEFIKDAIDNILQVIMGIFKVFAGLFTGDWEKTWEGVKDIFSGVFEQIKNILDLALNVVLEVIKFALNMYKEIFTAAFDAIKLGIETVWNSIKDFFTTIFNSIREIFNNFFNTIRNLLSNFKPLDLIKAGFESMKSFISGLIESIINKIKSFINNVRSALTSFNPVDAIRGGFQAMQSFVSGIIDSIVSKIQNFMSIFNSAKNLASKPIEVITKTTNVIETVTKAAGNVISKIPFFAEGGIVRQATLGVIGERGAEAVIPLDRMNDFMGTQPVNIYLDGRKITGTIAPQMVDMIRARVGSAY